MDAIRPERHHVLLWGPPGVGKTTIAAFLAALLDRQLADTDATITQATGRTPADLLRGEGEAAFRWLEQSTLRSLLARPEPCIISVGGGALVDEALAKEVLERALLVNLHAPLVELEERLRSSPAERPLLVDAEGAPSSSRLRGLLDARSAAYALGHYHLDTSGLDAEETARRLARALEDGLHPISLVDGSHYAVSIAPGRAPLEVMQLLATQPATSVFIVTDSTVAGLHLEPLVSALRGFGPEVVTLPGGEASKTAETALAVVEQLSLLGADRRSLVVGFGGGVVTDIAGFAASIFARGIRWVAVPTTTIGMVDAATGGKTGVNGRSAKNAVGTFHHPIAVVVDPTYTATESERAVRSGFAESVKTAAVADAPFFEWLEENASRLRAREADAVAEAVRRSVRVKAAIVESDPRERGLRAILNFGHTVGHALEAASHYDRFTHGEAVAVGMARALDVGAALGITPPDVGARVRDVLEGLGLDCSAPADLLRHAMTYLHRDKKREGQRLRFVLLQDVGRATTEYVTQAQVSDLLTG